MGSDSLTETEPDQTESWSRRSESIQDQQHTMKILLFLPLLQLLLDPVLCAPEGTPLRGDYYGAWQPWGSWGPCSRSCGTGVTVRTRQCGSQRTGGRSNCAGPVKAYRTCNIQKCAPESKDFREQQCSEFDGMEFEGRRHTWLAYYGGTNPCELNCIPRGENFFHRHRPAVVDGTPCYPGSSDICVEGVCKRLGCDNILESSKQEDPCLQCGGNGQSCFLVRNTFSTRDLPSGFHQIVTIPVGATTIRIREIAATRNYLAIRNARGEYYLNGQGVIGFARAIPAAGTMLYYQCRAESDNVPETIIARGPTTEQLVIELITQERNLGVEYEYYLPQGSQQVVYMWSYGPWTDCSSNCGTGYQSRHVFCTSNHEAEPEHLCAHLARPQSNRTCSLRECTRSYMYETGEWSTCSVSCGKGFQTRSVQCVSHDRRGRHMLEDSMCAAYAVRPPTQQACAMQPCAEYRFSSFGECSVTCGTGKQTREVFCTVGGARVPDYTCRSLPRPRHVQTCQKQECPDNRLMVYRPDHKETSTLTTVRDPYSTVRSLHCGQSYYGCCPDGHTTARGHHGEGCPQDTCAQSRYGCCRDGATAAQGPNREGCPDDSIYTSIDRSTSQSASRDECRTSTYGCCYDKMTVASGFNGEGCQNRPGDDQKMTCFLPSSPGPCNNWVARYYYNSATGSCTHFWYGGCHGNSNNFPTRNECQRRCHGVDGTQASSLPVPSVVQDTRRVPKVHHGTTNGRRHGTYRVRVVAHSNGYGTGRSSVAYRAKV
ncbi:papilin-like [Arapaima gigas]